MRAVKYVYIYRMTADTGLAPCVGNGLLSLACCKGGQVKNGIPILTGLRYWIGTARNGIDYMQDDVYIIGIYKSMFLYMARVTNVVTMEEYYNGMSNGRKDDIYSFDGVRLVRNRKFRESGVHTDVLQNIRDIAGKYVLISDDFIYLGKDAVNCDTVSRYAPETRGQKLYTGETAEFIISECEQFRDGKRHYPSESMADCGE